MSEIAKYLRFLINADKEAKITVVSVTETPTQFATQLTGENTRRRIAVHNRHASGSGECYYSFSNTASPSGESMVIPKAGVPDYLPVADTENIELYLFCDEGKTGSVQVIELS
jgi:hypothetical protein